MESESAAKETLGQWTWQWTVIGALYGVVVRLLFGIIPRSFGSPMSVAFLVATPIVVGAISIYGRRSLDISISSMIFRPWIAIACMLLGCFVSLLEGSICLFIMAPLFLVGGSIGGLAMGLLLRLVRPTTTHISVFALLPALVLLGEQKLPLHNENQEIRQTIEINAPPPIIWSQILNARNIKAEELPLNVAHLIGVPKPLEGINIETTGGEVRFSKWERGVNFRGVVTARVESQSITWRYSFDAHSFPPGSMDEHVEIGGRYFDLKDTTFNLRPAEGGKTQLEIVAHYRITSSINAYAVPMADYLGQSFINAILTLYKHRSERAGAV
ncbi:MAG: hypothetical protein QM808_12850 [Steroidobacteraceae bacterium]